MSQETATLLPNFVSAPVKFTKPFSRAYSSPQSVLKNDGVNTVKHLYFAFFFYNFGDIGGRDEKALKY